MWSSAPAVLGKIPTHHCRKIMRQQITTCSSISLSMHPALLPLAPRPYKHACLRSHAETLADCCSRGYPAGQQQPWPFYKQPWNIKGDTLILDVGSLQFQGNHPMFPPFNEDGCADACARTPGCNAWTFCSSKEGCGSGCRAYVEKNPPCECLDSQL